jgi:ABC-type nitrate/sulfonate/bicarbonate transport system ATPase subunit
LSDRIFVFHTAPGRIRTIVPSPLASARLNGDIRAHPQFGRCRAELRDMLGSDGEPARSFAS